MNAKSSSVSRVLLGLAVASILTLAGYRVLGQVFDPALPSTGTLEAQLLESSYQFSFTADPGVEVLKLTSSGGMTGITTTYSLYGDGKLVWRKMAHVDDSVPIIEFYEDNPVIRKIETELDFDQMRALVGIPVTHGLVETTREQILQRMKVVTWGHEDAGVRTLEVHLDSYSRQGLSPSPVDFEIVFAEPVDASRKYPGITPLQAYAKLVRFMNLELGLTRPK